MHSAAARIHQLIPERKDVVPRIDLFYYGDTSPGQSAAELYRDIEEQVVLGDQLGYNGVWVTEHHLGMRGEVPDPLLFLARLSGATSAHPARHVDRVRALLPPDPARRVGAAARRASRAVGSISASAPGVGDDRASSPSGASTRRDVSSRAAEVFEILRQAIDDGRVDFHGEFYDFTDVVDLAPRSAGPRAT